MNLIAANAIAPTAPPTEAGRSGSVVAAPPEAPTADRGRPARPDGGASPSAAPAKKSAKPRDHRLDFWRGLCLVDMVVVHLIFAGISFGPWASPLLGEYARFAAGGFVTVAGLSVGAIFLPRAKDPARRGATYKALWRRSAVILFVHYLAEIGYLAMWPMLGGVAADDVRGRIWHILTLRAGYDLLPFYVVMMLLAPLMLELLRRGLWWVLAAASVAAFAWGQYHDPWFLSLPVRHDFPPILWQLFFVAGVVGGAWLPAYDRLPRPVKVQVGTAFATSFAILFASCYAHDLGLYPFLPLTFAKLPLSTGEALRYFALVGSILVFTDLYWRRGDGTRLFAIDGSPVARFCQRLGRNSLPVYVFHAWVVQVMHRVHTNRWSGPEGTWQLWTAVVAVAAVWAFAWGLETWHAWRERVEARQAEAHPATASPRRSPLSLPGVRPAVSAGLVLVVVVVSNRLARVVAPQRHHTRQTQIDGPTDFGGASYVGDPLEDIDRADPVTPEDPDSPAEGGGE